MADTRIMVRTAAEASVDPGAEGLNRGMRIARFAGIAAVLVLGAALWHFLHPVIRRLGVGRTERANVVRLLEEWATTSLATRVGSHATWSIGANFNCHKSRLPSRGRVNARATIHGHSFGRRSPGHPANVQHERPAPLAVRAPVIANRAAPC